MLSAFLDIIICIKIEYFIATFYITRCSKAWHTAGLEMKIYY